MVSIKSDVADLTRLLVARGGDAAGSFLPGNANLVLDLMCLFHGLRLQRLPLDIVSQYNIFVFFAISELGSTQETSEPKLVSVVCNCPDLKWHQVQKERPDEPHLF